MSNKNKRKSLDEFLSEVIVADPRDIKIEHTPELDKKLETFEDNKFGIFISFGLYSEASTMESWLMNIESRWAREFDPKFKEQFNENDEEYIKWYLETEKRMNISKFNAKEWLDHVEAAGAKYFTFTAMHCDGYALYDSKHTDYKITNKHSKVKKDMLKELFDECEKRDIKKWLYFSKANWTSPHWQGQCYYDPKDKQISHENPPVIKPEVWDKYQQVFDKQIEELLTSYGKIDCLWLDCGWMRPDSGYDFKMQEIAKKARKTQEGLIFVDRAGVKDEDLWTPEQNIITEPITFVPWETVITIGNHWGYTTWDEYKDEHWVIDALLMNISCGGCLNLGVGPKGDGSWPEEVVTTLNKVGKFNKLNSEGIYATRAVAPFYNEQAYFTQSKDKKTVYAFVKNEFDKFEIPVEFEAFKNVTDVKGNKLDVQNNTVNLENYKSEDFKVRMIKLEK